jgi:hypothetical protein
MKTIRHNTFETNSSSTHSITIINKNDAVPDKTRYAQLVIDGVLHPSNLKHTFAYVSLQNSYEEGWILTASSRDEKSALLLHHVKSYLSDGWGRSYSCEEASRVLEFIRSFMTTLSSQRYADVVLDFSPDFGHYSEEEDSYVHVIMDNENIDGVFTSLINHINDVVNNDDMIVRASDEPY